VSKLQKGEMYGWRVREESDGRKEGSRSWRAVRKLAEVGLLTARKSVGVPETRAGCGAVGLGEQRFFADLCKNRTILPCAGGTSGCKQGPHKLVAWVDIDVFSSVKVRGRAAVVVPGAATFLRRADDRASVGRMRLRRRAENKSGWM
jgi:hypothetical protein